MPIAEGGASVGFDYTLSGVDWPGLCQTGQRQSPINIVSGSETWLDVPESLRPNLDFGTGTAVKVINFGRYFQVLWTPLRPPNASVTLGALFGQPNFTGPGVLGPNGTVIPGNGEDRVPLIPQQWHLHTPSEHAIDGKLAVIEAHLVTLVPNTSVPACGSAGCTQVFGVLYDIVEDTELPDTFLSPFLYDLPESIGTQYGDNFTSDFVLDFAEFFPNDTSDYVTYSGSLTTPPCTENVLWTVLLSNPTVSISQVETLANGQAVTQRPLECYPVPDSDLNLEQLQKPSGTFQICSAQGQRESDRFPQALHGRMVTRYA
ncbi:hypothetical protein WJX84_000109 [Apatococcus fuscideae]|uniref:carbonic anhydrase n=1 Tax=Apatococcus fuscideae TaxID=2026836 RepID=A0AAW1SKJ8_9CHLO